MRRAPRQSAPDMLIIGPQGEREREGAIAQALGEKLRLLHNVFTTTVRNRGRRVRVKLRLRKEKGREKKVTTTTTSMGKLHSLSPCHLSVWHT